MFKYSIQLAWSEEDNAYLATMEEFPGLSAFGDTPEEAAREARIAAEGFIKVMQEDGEILPEPHIRPLRHEAELNVDSRLPAEWGGQPMGDAIEVTGKILFVIRDEIRSLKADISALNWIIADPKRDIRDMKQDLPHVHGFPLKGIISLIERR